MSCSGQCCAVFYFPLSPAELRARWERAEGGIDDLMLADMLVEVPSDEVDARCERFGVVRPASDNKLYTCRHWDEDTRKCGVYDHRPRMCAGYPYAKKCEHCTTCGEVGEVMPAGRLWPRVGFE